MDSTTEAVAQVGHRLTRPPQEEQMDFNTRFGLMFLLASVLAIASLIRLHQPFRSRREVFWGSVLCIVGAFAPTAVIVWWLIRG